MEFAIVCPADAFNVDAVGRVAPAGQAVTNVDAVGPVTVKFTDTADTPEDGIPPRPVICTVIVRPGPTFTAGAPLPERVSNNRTGVAGLKNEAVGNHPFTSANTWVEPELL